LTVDPKGGFVFVTGQISGVYAFSIGSNGGLTPVPGSPFKTKAQPFSMTIDPKARFAYVGNANSADVSGYRISSTGTLNHVSGSPFPVGKRPVSLAVDPKGTFLFVSNYATTTISVESIGSGGALRLCREFIRQQRFGLFDWSESYFIAIARFALSDGELAVSCISDPVIAFFGISQSNWTKAVGA
jgi:6-phosphogluconolactonase (cycloisomerase 2 family)